MSDDATATGLVVGVDLGGTNAQFGVVDAAHAIVGRSAAKTEAVRGVDHVLDVIDRGIAAACVAAGIDVAEVAAVGIAAAGAIDIPRGVVLSAPNLGWTDVPLRDMVAARTGRPVVLDNDVNGAVWAEHRLGPAGGRGDAVGVWVGTGVGGGLILGGRLHYGAFCTAGEFGHTVLLPDAPRGRRTVEDNCSRTAFRVFIAEAGGPADMNTAAIAAAYAAGDPVVARVVNRGADLLGVAVGSLITMLALDRVILGGGITEALGAPYVDRIRASFDATVFPDRCRACRIDVTRLEADAGLLGAAMLARTAGARAMPG